MKISQEKFEDLMRDRERLRYLLYWSLECKFILRDAVDEAMLEDKEYQEELKVE